MGTECHRFAGHGPWPEIPAYGVETGIHLSAAVSVSRQNNRVE